MKIPKPLLLGVYLVVVSTALYLLFQNWVNDDAFITYRYALNLQRGTGFVYNPGERVLSTTTPLFAILLAFFLNFSADLPHVAIGLGSLALALGAIFLWLVAEQWNVPLVGWAALALYPTFSMLLVTLGMETPVCLALCLGAFAFYARQSYRSAALCAGLAVLTRADAGIVAVLLSMDYVIWVRRPVPWSALLIFCVIIFPWFVFSWFYFGSLVPATLFAKQQQAVMAPQGGVFAAGFFQIVRGLNQAQWVEAILGIAGVAVAIWHKRRWSTIAIWAPLYFAAYAILGVGNYPWYYAPLVPSFIAATGLGLDLVARALRRYPRVANVVWLALLILLGAFQFYQIEKISQKPDVRFQTYRAIGEWLDANSAPGATVGAFEIGIIGYYAGRPIVDLAGLVQPDVARQFKRGGTWEQTAVYAVERYRPRYLVLHDKSMPQIEAGYASQSCVPSQTFPAAQYGMWVDMTIYDCSKQH